MASSTYQDEEIPHTIIDQDEEERHFRKVIGAFLYYR
jgi:hypothetical protein